MADDQPARVRWRDASWEGRGKRIGTWCFLAFAAWFIVSTVVQIAQGVYVAEVPLAADSACRARLLPLVRAVDRAAAATASGADPGDAARSFQAALAPEWDVLADAEASCRGDERAKEAYIDVLRLRDARERSLVRGAGEFGAIRRSLGVRLDAR